MIRNFWYLINDYSLEPPLIICAWYVAICKSYGFYLESVDLVMIFFIILFVFYSFFKSFEKFTKFKIKKDIFKIYFYLHSMRKNNRAYHLGAVRHEQFLNRF